MSRYANMFEQLKDKGEGAFGTFVMLGDPDLATSARLLRACVEGGADMVEVGIPFSDPIADGPVIQAAACRALKAGVRPADCFRLLAEFRIRHAEIPVGILTYANLVVSGGMENFYRFAADAGVDSVLVADVPALEAAPFAGAAQEAGIDPVLIAAGNAPPTTLQRIARLSSGYVYCVSRAGVTGARSELALDHREMLSVLSEAGAAPPIFGFGISKREHVRTALAEGAAGVICGSAIVKLIETADGDPIPTVRSFIASMKDATRPSLVEQSPTEGAMEAGNVR